MASGGDELSPELSGPEGDNITISPQDISRWVTAGEYILKKKRMRKEVERGSSGLCLILEVFGVACCCVCKVCILYKKGQ